MYFKNTENIKLCITEMQDDFTVYKTILLLILNYHVILKLNIWEIEPFYFKIWI